MPLPKFKSRKTKSKIIGVVGSRRRDSMHDFRKCYAAVNAIYKPGDIFVSGGCPTGRDAFIERICSDNGYTIVIHFPNWKKEGKIAGLLRNTKIAEDCDVLIAVVAKDRTGGAEDTIRKATKLGKKIILVT